MVKSIFFVSSGQIVAGAIIVLAVVVGVVLFVFPGLSLPKDKALEGPMDPTSPQIAAAEKLCLDLISPLPFGTNWSIACSSGYFLISVDVFSREDYKKAVEEALNALRDLGMEPCSSEMSNLIFIQNSRPLRSDPPVPGEVVWEPCG